MKMNRIFAL